MSIQEAAQQRILADMIDTVGKEVTDWKVLLVDPKTLRIISTACRMYDVMEKGISVVEDVLKARQPLRKLDAIYFLSPTKESVKAFIGDWERDKPLYAHSHLFFSSHVPEDLFKMITKSKAKKKIRTFKELNLEFLAFESQAFQLDDHSALRSLFASSPDEEVLNQIASQLVTVCLTLGEYPYIRHMSTPVASDVASAVHKQLRGISAEEREQLTDGDDRAILLIVDRTMDPVAPFLHEFTYQAMVYDLLNIEKDNIYKYQFTSQEGKTEKTVEKQVLLDERDFLWPKLRHMHIADCISRVIDDFNRFLKTNKAVSLNREANRKVTTLKEMSKAMKDMPQFQEMFAKFSLHIRLAGECMDQYNGKELEKLALVEQDLATGKDASGEPIDKAAVIKALDVILRDESVSTKDKVRLILILIGSLDNLKGSDRDKRIEVAGLGNAEVELIENMSYIGVTLENGIAGRKERERKLKKKKKTRELEEEHVPYQVSRFVPVLRDYLEDLCSGDMSTSDVPFCGDEPRDRGASKDSAPKAKSLKTTSRKKQQKGKEKGESQAEQSRGARIIVFVVGGMTWSEVRTAYEMTQLEGRDILIGGTSVLTPSKVLEEVGTFNKRKEKKKGDSDEEV